MGKKHVSKGFGAAWGSCVVTMSTHTRNAQPATVAAAPQTSASFEHVDALSPAAASEAYDFAASRTADQAEMQAELLSIMDGLSGRDGSRRMERADSAEGTERTGSTERAGSTERIGSTERTDAPDVAERIGAPAAVSVDIVLPVHNQASVLDSNIRTLMGFLIEHAEQRADFTWNIVIADTASSDDTWRVASGLAQEFPDSVRALRIVGPGRGRALKIAWGESGAQVVSYMDIDLSTDIKDIGFLIGSLLVGGADIAIGSRLLSESQVDRSLKREFISRTYNMMLHSYLNASFHDAQCGFKAVTAEAAHALLPLVCDDGLFFDTELLLLAQSAGMLIYEIPVVWTESESDAIDISDTVQRDLEGMRRMKRTFTKGVAGNGRKLPWSEVSNTADGAKASRKVRRKARKAAAAGTMLADSSSGPNGVSSDDSSLIANAFVHVGVAGLKDAGTAASTAASPQVETISLAAAQTAPRESFTKLHGKKVPIDMPLTSTGKVVPRAMLVDVADVSLTSVKRRAVA
jgi:glycosyltransferase involved in cell wall biosynthesis